MDAYTQHADAFPPAYLERLRRGILSSPYFTTHTLNRDFVGTRGFSIVFRDAARARVERDFPYLQPYLERSLRADCNGFYLNPLLLEGGSRVDPHVDRSLRSYCKTVDPPVAVSVLYVDVSSTLRGGHLVLSRGKKRLARLRPVTNTLLFFAGDLTHGIELVEGGGTRLSLVCEQYCLTSAELELVPDLALETRAREPY